MFFVQKRLLYYFTMFIQALNYAAVYAVVLVITHVQYSESTLNKFFNELSADFKNFFHLQMELHNPCLTI